MTRAFREERLASVGYALGSRPAGRTRAALLSHSMIPREWGGPARCSD